MLTSDNAASVGGDRPSSAVELVSLSTRSYLDKTVVPILLDAMASVAKERYVQESLVIRLLLLYFRPPDPIEHLAAYLLKHRQNYQDRSTTTEQSS